MRVHVLIKADYAPNIYDYRIKYGTRQSDIDDGTQLFFGTTFKQIMRKKRIHASFNF